MIFPPSTAATRAGEVEVRGQARDASAVASVVVAGVGATTTDGYGSWSAVVPITFGDNTIEVVATDARGNVATDTLHVRRRDELVRPFTHELDPSTGLVWMLDLDAQDLRTLDLVTGVVRVVSRNEGGMLLGGSSIGFALDTLRSRALVLNRSPAGLMAIDLDTGERTALTPSYANGLAPIADPVRAVIDPLDDVAYVLDLDGASPGRVLRVDLDTLEVDLVAEDAVVGTGTFTGTTAIDLDEATGRIIGLNRDLDMVYALAPDTGAVTLLSSNASPSNDAGAFDNSVALEVDPDLQLAYVFDFEPRRIFSVDISSTTGERRLVSASDEVAAQVRDLRDLILLDGGATLLALDAFAQQAFEIDVDTGTHGVAADNSFPEPGPTWAAADGMTFDPSRERAVLTNGGSVLVVDGDTGARTVLSSDSVGVGVPFDDTWDVVFDAARDRYVVLGGGRLWAVDPGSGDRELLSGPATGTGPSFEGAYRLVHDSSNDRYLVVTGDVIAIDPDTGNRSVLSAEGDPEPIDTRAAVALLIDIERNRLLVLSGNGSTTGQYVLAVDLDTGARSVVDDDANPNAQEPYGYPYGLALAAGSDRLVISDLAGRLLELDLETGVRSLFVETSDPYEESLAEPGMLAWGGGDASLGLEPRLYVVDFGAGAAPRLAVVDPSTGSLATVSR